MISTVPLTCVFVRRGVRIRQLTLGLSAMLGWGSLLSCRSDMVAGAPGPPAHSGWTSRVSCRRGRGGRPVPARGDDVVLDHVPNRIGQLEGPPGSGGDGGQEDPDVTERVAEH